MERYQVLEKLGEGAQGIVSKAKVLHSPPNYDEKTEGKIPEIVAMKKMKIANKAGGEIGGLGIETIREILILRELKHSNIISIIDIFGRGDNLYMIMPFMCADLEILIKNKNIALTAEHIKAYMIMLLKGTEYIHSKYILHRDLKPSNCLIGPDNVLRISDFGLSREYGSMNRLLSHQACTIWYRAPELLFGAEFYGPAMDIWSVGCIFGELCLRFPMFPGYQGNALDQMAKIFTVLGTPDQSVWPNIEMLKKFRRFEKKTRADMKSVFTALSSNGIEFFLDLCKYDPLVRPSATIALKHTYFSELPNATPAENLPNLIK